MTTQFNIRRQSLALPDTRKLLQIRHQCHGYCISILPTNSRLTPLAQTLLMRSRSRGTRANKSLHRNATPCFQPVHHALGIRVVRLKLAELITSFASLLVHSSIILTACVVSNRDRDDFTWPALGRTSLVGTLEAAHDVGVTGSEHVRFVVYGTKGELEIAFAQ